MKRISRREFLKSTGAAVGVFIVASCTPGPLTITPPNRSVTSTATETIPPLPASTSTQSPTETLNLPKFSTSTPWPTPEIKLYRRPELIRFFPDGKSRMVKSSDAKVWDGETLNSELLCKLLDGAVTHLTSLTDGKEAWQALFSPNEKIVIKVNAFRSSLIWTHAPLVYALIDRLTAAGIPAENITIYDYYTSELKTAGYTINQDGPGVRCYGTDHAYTMNWRLGGTMHKISDILVAADAIINIPVLKVHDITGITFALKNHYGSVQAPSWLHTMPNDLVSLNESPFIKNATRLVIGDILGASIDPRQWLEDVKGDSILMSYDPLAVDWIGLDILRSFNASFKDENSYVSALSSRWMDVAQKAGIGAADLKEIELISDI